MGAVTLVGVGPLVWGTTTATPASAGTPSNGDQPYILAVSKRPSVAEPSISGWTAILSQIVNAGGTVTGNQGPMYVQVFKRDTVVSGGSITWPAVANSSGAGQVIGVASMLARAASGEALEEATTYGQDLDDSTSCTCTGVASLALGVGDLVVALSAICDNSITSSGGTITASGITFGATTEQEDSSTGNGDDLGCYIHTAAVTAGTATSAPVLTQTLSTSNANQTRVGTGFLRIRSLATSVPKSGSDSGVGSEAGSVAAAVTGSDSGVGSETGFVADLKSGSDSGIGSDSGFVAQLNDGSDTGTGSEAGALAATTSGGDSGVGSESVALAATTSGSDTATGAESGFITLPGSDAGTGSGVLDALDASTSGGDTGVGSEGGYVEELFGDLVVALFAVDPDSGALLPLPDHKAFTVSRERNGAGTISLTYPVDGLNFAVLRDTITTDRDLEVEIWTIGQKTGAMRGFLQEASGDDVKEDRTWSFSGGFAELLMGEAVAWPAPIITITTVVTTTKLGESSYQIVTKTTTASSEGGPPVTTTVTTSATSGTEGTTTSSKSTNGDLEFKAVTPGELMTFLVEQAQDRDALDGLELGFTATHDSAGVEWPDVITTKFSPGSRYDSMLSRLVDFGLAEWGVTWTGTAYRLDLWVIFGRGVDRTTGLRPVVLRKARNLIDAPRKWSVRDAGTAILAAGGEGVYEEASDADALARRGRRIERSASANNLTDAAAVQAFAQNQLHLLAVGRLEVAHGIGFLPGEPRPVIAFDIGDWIYSQSSAGLERLRVVQWTLSVDDQGPSGTVTLNDTITDWLSRLKAMIDNLTSGDTVVGTSQSSPGQDSSTPLPPEVLSADSIAFLDGTLGVRAAVTVAWDPPVLNVDGTVITDLAGFNVQFALATSPDVWNAGITVNSGTADHAVFTAPAGETITIRVNAVDRNGNTSVWSDPPYPHTTSDDDIPPPVPSDAVVSEFLGTVRISWDGLTADGAIMYEAAIDFDHIEVHLSPGSLFTPDDSTLVGRMYGLGTFTVTDLPYGVEQFARFVAVDWSGNRSDPSGQGSATPAQVVEDDVFDGAIGTAKLQDAAIVTAKIANLAVNDAKIGSLSVGKLTAGSLNADVILASGGIKTATSGTRVELDSAGLRLYNGSNTVVDLKTSNGSALVVGEFRTSLTGQRIVFNPGGALADTMNFYPSAAGDFARIMARTAPGDGTAAILIDGGAANGTSRGRIGAYKSEAFISYVTNDAGGDTTAGFSRTAVSASNNTVLSWVQTEFDIDKYSGNSRLSGSRHRLMWVQTSGNWFPVWRSEWGSGIKLDNGNVVATNDGTDYVPFHCSTLVEHSSIITKQDIVDIDTHFDPDAVMAGAPGKGWRYRDDVDRDGDDAFVHFGPLAEDLPEVMHRATNYRDGTAIGISLDDKVGVIWETVRRLLSRVDQIESTIDTPESE